MNKFEQFSHRVELVRNCLASNPEAGRHVISKATGIPLAAVARALHTIRSKKQVRIPGDVLKAGQRTVETTPSRTAPSLQSLVDECDINLQREQVDHHIINRYEQASKHPETGVVTVTPMWQIKAWLSPIKAAQDATIVRETIEWIRANSPIQKISITKKATSIAVEDPAMLEISIPDSHIGRLTWAPETGENQDTKSAASDHQKAVEALWHRASVFPIQKVLYAIPGDFFNVDNDKNETTAGTFQSEDDRWSKTFRVGIATLRTCIDFLRARCPDLEVRFIGGNHDRTRLFYAGEVIAAMYEGVPGVTVVNEPKVRQYIQWGNVLLGLTHGDGAKQDKLPLIMASEASTMWGNTTWREFHMGHLHHRKETQYHSGIEHNAVRVRILPALCSTDFWHSLHGFVSQRRAAEAYVWGKKSGFMANFSWSPCP